jgi:uncharacterized protein YllA (UPF0747 family)
VKASLAAYPGMNRFVLDWLGGDERFLPRATAGSSRSLPRSSEADRTALAAAMDAQNRGWGIFAGDQLQRWAAGSTLTVVAGQQVGFAGGPLYTLAKAATLVRLKRDLAKQGIDVTPFFWLATEDHDFDEVATLNVPVSTLGRAKAVNRQVDLVCMRAVRSADRRAMVGSLPVPEALITELLSLYDLPRPSWLRSGVTFRDSFAELLASVFGSELILVDALLPELRRAGASLFDRIRASEAGIQQALHQRAAKIEQAGYREQVIARDGSAYTLLFEIDEHGHRTPSMAPVAPEKTSTSALTRPLLQDAVLQPDIFVGGPAEVAYYAQIAPLHEMLGVTMPRVALRGHVLVVPHRVARALDRYGVEPEEVFRAPEAILAEREPRGVAEIRTLVEDGRRELMERIERIGEIALPADHSLAGSIEKSIGHLEYHFEKLAERATRAMVRKDRDRYAAVRSIVETLYPDRHVQDRVVSWFGQWHRYGAALVERIIEEVEPDSSSFTIVEV